MAHGSPGEPGADETMSFTRTSTAWQIRRDGNLVASCYTSEEDAKLLMAAPTLLGALKALTKLDEDASGGIIIGPQGWRIVQDAIQEATQ